MIIRKISKETKLQVFQYKVLHQIIPTQLFLYRAKISESPVCKICKMSNENVEHMLYDCESTKNTWLNLIVLFEQRESIEVQCNTKSCLFGIFSKNNEKQKWNYVSLLFRYYIYRTKSNNQTINLSVFLQSFKCHLNLKSLTYQSENEQEDFDKQWEKWM